MSPHRGNKGSRHATRPLWAKQSPASLLNSLIALHASLASALASKPITFRTIRGCSEKGTTPCMEEKFWWVFWCQSLKTKRADKVSIRVQISSSTRVVVDIPSFWPLSASGTTSWPENEECRLQVCCCHKPKSEQACKTKSKLPKASMPPASGRGLKEATFWSHKQAVLLSGISLV